MEIHQLQYVVAVAKYKNFSRAAEEVNVGQSGLSQQIAKLEFELGIKLFDRSSRTVLLTPAGAEFVEYAREILTKIETAKQHMDAYAGLIKGDLSIGTITSLPKIDFGSLISSFHEKYSGLSLNIIQEGSIKLIELLRTGQIDVAFLTLPPFECEDLSFHFLAKDDYVMVTSDKHRFAKMKSLDLAEARNETFIFQKKNQSMHAICLQACNKAGFEPKIFCFSSGSSISFSLIRSGLGIGFFPSKDLESYRIPGLATIKLREPLYKHLMLATVKKTDHSPPINALRQHVIEWIGASSK
jgi:DNA-binding transcriptional LysR family regulator